MRSGADMLDRPVEDQDDLLFGIALSLHVGISSNQKY
jgi:hypothetical protein